MRESLVSGTSRIMIGGGRYTLLAPDPSTEIMQQSGTKAEELH